MKIDDFIVRALLGKHETAREINKKNRAIKRIGERFAFSSQIPSLSLSLSIVRYKKSVPRKLSPIWRVSLAKNPQVIESERQTPPRRAVPLSLGDHPLPAALSSFSIVNVGVTRARATSTARRLYVHDRSVARARAHPATLRGG